MIALQPARLRAAAVLLGLSLLAGCASLPSLEGRSESQSLDRWPTNPSCCWPTNQLPTSIRRTNNSFWILFATPAVITTSRC